MKNSILLLTILVIIAENICAQNRPFYYYQGERIFLTEQQDKLLIKVLKSVDKTKLKNLIDADVSVQMSLKEKTKKDIGTFVVLESRTNKAIPSSTFKNTEITRLLDVLYQCLNSRKATFWA